MAQIKDEKQYNAIMARIDQLFFETDENTPADPHWPKSMRKSIIP